MSINMTATELWEQDARFRARVIAAVASAMDEARQHVREEDLRWKDVHHIATEAAANALKSAFEGDAEISALRIERDHYQKIALHGLETRPVVLAGHSGGSL
jgi:leucyl aminopeptidase (aminopeptidase T)